jgi:hypothetical protein
MSYDNFDLVADLDFVIADLDDVIADLDDASAVQNESDISKKSAVRTRQN